MSTQQVKVHFTPGDEVITVISGELLLNAAIAAKVRVNAPCGGKGTCLKCRVMVISGECSSPSDVEQRTLLPQELASGVRLACQARVMSDAVVHVPPTSRVIGKKPLEEDLVADVDVNPAVVSCEVNLPKPDLDDQRSDFVRLSEQMGAKASHEASLTALRALPRVLRENDYHVNAITAEKRLLDCRPASDVTPPLGVAVDIGTTTVVAYLVDLQSGKPLGTGAAHNPQGVHGADVIARTEYASSHAGGLLRLQQAAADVVNEVIGQALSQCGGDTDHIYEMTVVGNTCMHHLFAGLDPQYIAQAPYIPVNSRPMCFSPGELGVKIHPEGRIVLLPIVAGYVGADTVGVIAATRMTDRPDPVLAIDIGTNGEVALWTGERLLCASCAAGPAFEGAQIQHGMRAAPGAIEQVDLFDDDLKLQTIDGLPPVGICGSGLFDAMAVLLDASLVDMMGRMAEAKEGFSAALQSRLQGTDGERCVVLARGEDSVGGQDICLSQKDVRELQLAKGAVRAAVEILLKQAGLAVDDLSEVLLAGAFGNYIRPASALRMGLLPPMPTERIRGVGNAAGAGAMLALISTKERERFFEIARVAEHVELARNTAFQSLFMETMLFM